MKYRKIARLGHGGMAQVTLAVSRGPAGFSKLLVLKELRSEVASDPDFLKMFLDEARVSARLQHPNIVHTYDVVSEGAEHYLVLEYLQGQPLNKIRSRGEWKDFPLGFHLRTLADTLAGLQYSHELADFDGKPLNIVHRDVSPQNVFVCYDGQVKLVDFGVARVRGAESHTATGVVKGKLGYVAPEVLSGGELDGRADLFAVGVMLWEAIARRRISLGRTDAQIAGARIGGTDPRLEVVAPDAPPELVEICAKAMSLRPDDRYPTALAFKEALEKHIDGKSTNEALGKFVAEAFATEREGVARVVQEYLARPEDGDESLPSIHVAGEHSDPSASSQSSSSSSSDIIVVPTSTTLVSPPEGRRKRVAMIAAGSVALLCAGAVALWSLPGSRATGPVEAAPSAVASIAAPPTATPAPSANEAAGIEQRAASTAAASADAAAPAEQKAPGAVAAGVPRTAPPPKDATQAKTPAVPPPTVEPPKKRDPRAIIESDPYGGGK